MQQCNAGDKHTLVRLTTSRVALRLGKAGWCSHASSPQLSISLLPGGGGGLARETDALRADAARQRAAAERDREADHLLKEQDDELQGMEECTRVCHIDADDGGALRRDERVGDRCQQPRNRAVRM